MKPDWKLLVAFEAVARHGSFSRGAEELNVQQPAMSRRVAALETMLGVRLLHRSRPTLSLSAEGDILYRAISGSLIQVQTACDQIARRAEKSVVVVNTTIGFASCFLMKRLHAFRDAHPDITIELVSRDQSETYHEAGADVIIMFDAPANLPGVRQELIFAEEMIAVCTPNYLSEPAKDRAELLGHRLFHLTKGIHADDWAKYLEGAGLEIPVPGSSERFTSFIIYLQAVLNGEGIALGWEHLLEEHLANGTLIRAAPHVVKSERGYFACLTQRAERNLAASRFLEWASTLVSAECS